MIVEVNRLPGVERKMWKSETVGKRSQVMMALTNHGQSCVPSASQPGQVLMPIELSRSDSIRYGSSPALRCQLDALVCKSQLQEPIARAIRVDQRPGKPSLDGLV